MGKCVVELASLKVNSADLQEPLFSPVVQDEQYIISNAFQILLI